MKNVPIIVWSDSSQLYPGSRLKMSENFRRGIVFEDHSSVKSEEWRIRAWNHESESHQEVVPASLWRYDGGRSRAGWLDEEGFICV
jgi:hypothetical protein